MESILKPRRENNPATRRSTPGWFSASTAKTALLSSLTYGAHNRPFLSPPSVLRLFSKAPISSMISSTVPPGGIMGRTFIRGYPAVHHRPPAARAASTGSHFVGAGDPHPRAAERFRQLTEVGFAVGIGGRETANDLLPLPHHPEHLIVHHQHHDRKVVRGQRGQLVQIHMEAAVPRHQHHPPAGEGRLSAPMAAPSPYPIVPSPPEVSKVRGCRNS